MIGRYNNTYALYCLPLAICLVVLTLLPLLFTGYFSLTSWNLGVPGSNRFTGIANYVSMFLDPSFLHATWVTFLYVIIPVPLQIGLGLGLGLLLHQEARPIKLSRPIFTIPMVIPPVVVGVIWKMMFMPKMGGLDQVSSIFGYRFPDLLSTPLGALASIIMAVIWEWTPFVTLMVLAALESLPDEPFEAARIDGASGMQTFIYVTLPLLRPILLTATLLRIIGSLEVFPVVYSMTGGGPGAATEPINFYAFRRGFEYFEVGYASAIALFIFLFVAIFGGFFLRASQKTLQQESW